MLKHGNVVLFARYIRACARMCKICTRTPAMSVFMRLKHSCKQLFPPPPAWRVEDIPDQTGRVHVVTGGNAGIGRETVKVRD